jgi:TRAP-type C4-dicarboxylate transport system substrate-binding protein
MDGGWMDGQRVIADKLWEVAPYALSGPNWACLFVSLYMNAELFNSLPLPYQKTILDVSRQTLAFGLKLERKEAAEARSIIEPKMKRLLWMPDETMLKFRTKQEPAIEAFVKKYGTDAARVWEIMKAQ